MQELAKPQRRELTDAEAVKIVREITRGSRSEEIIENALALYKPYVMPIFRRIAELHEQGAIKELSDYELYEILLRAGIRVPLKTEIKIVRHGREYRLGELS
ncbi:MAG: DNA-binding protein [Thermoproteaceae archaeon]|nr:DNA-binding protein [Thermoproteaceae archaeon]